MNARSVLDQILSRRQQANQRIRLLRATGLLAAIFVIGTVGFHQIGGSDTTWLDAAYMTVITLTTVGYDESIPVSGDPAAQLFTIFVITVGIGTFLYFVSALAAFVIEGELADILWRRKLQKKIESMDQHYIIAGVGKTGTHVFPQIAASGRDCVLIDRDVESIQKLFDESGQAVPFIEGDATDDDCLRLAGIERAAGIVFSLGNDRDNLFATMSAHHLNANLTIVTRGEDRRSEQKFRIAGATSVIYTDVLGGTRMAAELLRPQVSTFLDLMIADHDHHRTIESIAVPDDSPIVGKRVEDLGLHDVCDALIVAVRDQSTGAYHFNPQRDFVIETRSALIVLALVDDIPKIQALIGGTVPA